MRDAFRLYLRYLGISTRAQLQYRASFAFKLVGYVIVTAIEFLGIWALFARFGSLAGWTLPEVALIYGTIDTSFGLADGIGRGLSRFSGLLRDGAFDRMLVRPRSTVLQLLGFDFRLLALGRLAQGFAVLGWAGAQGAVAWTPGKVALVAASIAGGGCVFLGLAVIEATSAFWTIESLELWNALSHGGNYAGQYPMSIYKRQFRWFFLAIVPIALVGYWPMRAVLGRDALDFWHAVAPLAGPAFFAASLGAWRIGVRHHSSTGS